MQWEEMKKIPGISSLFIFSSLSQTVPWFQCLCILFSVCHILNNFSKSRFQFSSSLINSICILLSYLSIEFLVPVIIIFISLGCCSRGAGSLRYGFQTHVEDFFPQFHSFRSESKKAASLSSHYGLAVFYFAFQRFCISTRWTERSSLILVSGLSPSLDHQAPADGPGPSSQPSLPQRFLLVSDLGGFLYFRNSSVMYFKTCF